MNRAPLESRRILTIIIKRQGAATALFVSGEQANKIVVEDGTGNLFGYADFVESLGLCFKDGVVPSAREKGGVRSKEQTLRPNNIQNALKDSAKIEMALFVTHPAIAARSIQIYVRA